MNKKASIVLYGMQLSIQNLILIAFYRTAIEGRTWVSN